MKRVFEHPPQQLTGKRYWRSLGELSDTPEFRGWLEREFPAGAAQLEGDEWSRRGLLQAARFTWERSARGHDDVYRELFS